MTTDAVLAELARRGLQPELRDGRPVLRGDKDRMTPRLRAVLSWHREEIVKRLMPKPVREWLWRSGRRYRESPEDSWLYGREDRHPSGAWWWRFEGEDEWRAVEGRPVEGEELPCNLPSKIVTRCSLFSPT